ncbi:baseplate J/gp47 family protein [Sutterella sp.]|uniref:baseplate J/gp47 family protein n=1 Tax=Sutterella sp. TaxID=1981025 RepID=UPI0026DF2B88|nr:baseplate J/gp47 family protein [Sutterella sp.]MDO5531431.1 baseplate J/gp47 family protein [Sutterella sp.]
MSFERPTLSEIITRVQSDIESRLGKKVMRWSLAAILARVIAGVSHSLHGYIVFVLKQCFSSTAEGAYLERRASEYGITRNSATKAEGTVTFTGSGTVPSGTQLQSSESVVYVTTADSDETAMTAPIEAVAAGESGNADAGLTLTLVSPVTGIDSTATAGELSGGADAEDDESLRERLLERQKSPPRGGTAADYVAWAKDVTGVTRAWCYPREPQTGHVTVRFMTDDLTDNGIPTDTMVTRVEEAITAEMPIAAVLHVEAPTPLALDCSIMIIPETEAVKAKVEAAIQTAIVSEAEPGETFMLTALDRAVAGVSEITSYRISVPSDDLACDTGEIYVPGTITWV